MGVPVVGIREMVMNMLQWRVIVPMIMIGYRLAPLAVLMLVMTIVGVLMLMLLRFVHMLVFVSFGQMQPDTQCHECSSDDQTCVDRFTQKRDCQCHSKKRSDREIGTCPGCSNMAQCNHEKNQANAIGKTADK